MRSNKITPDDILATLPPKLVARLMQFQKEGVKFAVNKNGRCLLADEMGLGKTLQAISIAYYYREEWPLLIIVPSSLRYAWIEEFEKWLPDIDPSQINLIQSGSDASGIGSSLVTITTFGMLSKSTSNIVREALVSQGFQVVIVDESHYIRNIKTASCRTVVPLIKNANRRLLLSGTPALSRPVELYPQIDAICPNAFGSWWSYTSRYCDAKIEWIGKIKKRSVNGASNLEELQQRLSSSVMIRREKSEVLTQLPPKQRQRVLFELKDSELKKEIRQTFDELYPLLKKGRTDRFEVLSGAADHDAKDTSSLGLIQRLYQLSGEAKIGPAKEYIEMLCENPKLKFLVFAYHHAMMNGLSQSLYDKKVKFIRIDGKTPQSERPHLVHQFQSDPDTRVAVLSILAAGVGLTFTAASVVVFAEMYWTPGTMVQCEDRAHRIGQTGCVAVHYLVAKDTIDEWVWSAVCKKTVVTSTALTGRQRQMEADAGDSYQVDVLSNADAWVPKENESLDLAGFFETQQETDQKSILDFFNPSRVGYKKPTHSSQPTGPAEYVTPTRHADPNGSIHPLAKKPRLEVAKDATPVSEKSPKTLSPSKNIILIDSGTDDEDFALSATQRLMNSASQSGGKLSSKRKRKDKPKKLAPTPKQNLTTMFAKSKSDKCSGVTEAVVLSDGEMEEADRLSTPTRPVPHKRTACQSKKNDSAKADGRSNNTEDSVTPWSCSLCTYSNHKDLVFCEMCATPKKQKSIKHETRSRMEQSISDSRLSSSENSPDNVCHSGVNKTARKMESEKPDANDVCVSAALKEIDEFEKLKKMSESFVSSSKKKYNTSCDMNENSFDDSTAAEFPPNRAVSNRKITHIKGSLHRQTTLPSNQTPDGQHPLAMDAVVSDSTHSPTAGVDKTNGSVIKGSLSGVETPVEKPSGSLYSREADEDIDIDVYDSPVDVTKSQELLTVNKSCIENSKHSSSREHHNKMNEVNCLHNRQEEQNICEKCNHIDEHENQKLTETKLQSNVFEAIAKSEQEPDGQNLLRSKADLSQTSNNAECTPPQTKSTPKQYRFKSVTRRSPMANLSPFQSQNSKIHCVTTSGVASSQPMSDLTNVRERSDNDHHAQDTKALNKDSFHANTVEASDLTPVRKPNEGSNISDDYVFSSPEIEDYFSDDMLETASEKGSIPNSSKLSPGKRIVDIDNIPVYNKLYFQCSKYTGRVYVLSKEDEPLNVNFLPMDVHVGNSDELPDILLHPSNLRLVQKFVREWQSLIETRRRLIIKSGRTFVSPLQEYEELKSCKTINTQRHKTKENTAVAARKKATEVNGSVRVISKRSGAKAQQEQLDTSADGDTGVTQAVGEDGVPLCLQCFAPYENRLLQQSTIVSDENAWKTRFCSQKCSQQYWMTTNNDYCRNKVYEAEHGICQICGVDAHALFKQTRDTQDLQRRAEVIARSKFSSLNLRTKQLMVKKPVAGQFWHADHITPVWEGGGQCDIDNLRTLCVPCHHKITAKQAGKRATVRRLGSAAGQGDISAFFQKA